jgi:ABC-type Fe3+ transport system permease subunit
VPLNYFHTTAILISFMISPLVLALIVLQIVRPGHGVLEIQHAVLAFRQIAVYAQAGII